MPEKLKIDLPIIVEGRYDRQKLLSVCDARIITTDGFAVFKKSEKLALIRALAEKSRVILLADSDGAGTVIRSYLTSALPKEKIIQLYIPKIEGKEKRKSEPSKEGTLGVDGMPTELLFDLLKPYASGGEVPSGRPITKADFYEDGLSGAKNSAEKRDVLAKKLNLPSGMTPNALLSAVNFLISYDEYKKIIKSEV
ncbi:MAG: DUF4093 domain-containing protein [Clostridia bacterium]|nr:DUF4093 domain-containing protein [Clostridia bacterium]